MLIAAHVIGQGIGRHVYEEELKGEDGVDPQAVVQPRVVHQVLQAMDAHRGGWGPCSKSKHAVHVNPPRTGPDGRALGPRPASEQTPTSSPPTERVNVQRGVLHKHVQLIH